MRWTLAIAQGEDLKEYHLIEDSTRLLLLRYNSLQQSVRIQGKGEYHSFFVERTGLINTRVLFKNGYGVDLGQCTFNRLHNAGHMEIENKRYQYIISSSYPAKATLSEINPPQLPVICEWPFHGKYPLTIFKQGYYEQYATLLLGLHCYTQLFINKSFQQMNA